MGYEPDQTQYFHPEAPAELGARSVVGGGFVAVLAGAADAMVSATQADRHKCEVRHVLELRSRRAQFSNDYLELVAKRRGAEAVSKLRSDCASQWSKGNRGKWGTWIEDNIRE